MRKEKEGIQSNILHMYHFVQPPPSRKTENYLFDVKVTRTSVLYIHTAFSLD